MKYTIIDIVEEDYGCEGVPENEEPMCSVLARDSSGYERWLRIADPYLTANRLDVGSELEVADDTVF